MTLSTVNIFAVQTQRGTPSQLPCQSVSECSVMMQRERGGQRCAFISVRFDCGGRGEMQSRYIMPVLCLLCHKVWHHRGKRESESF